MEQEHKKRIEAVKRYFKGEKPVKIYRSLGKNRRWLHFWVTRYNPDDPEWFKDKSRKPKTIANKIPQDKENLVVNIRKKLEETKYSQIGANAIRWELFRLGKAEEELPTIATINRIIKRNDLVKVNKKKTRENKKYPVIAAKDPNQLQSLDLVGPRFLKNDGSFYSFNLIDVYSHAIKICPYRGKTTQFALDFLVHCWQRIGIPRYLQVDNELSFRGSNKYPRTFGDFIKICLYFGVELIFIPPREPWRQGVIEKFNDVYDKLFFRKQVFTSFKQLKTESTVFERFHNRNHYYSEIKNVPIHIHNSVGRKVVPKSFDLHKKYIPFKEGKVSFIRFTNEKGQVSFFSETFTVDKFFIHEYVKGTIDTKSNLLRFFYDDEIIKVYQYEVNKQ